MSWWDLAAPGLRWMLLGLALLWALLAWRGRRWPTLLGGLLFSLASLGFWTASLARSYGLAEATPVAREAAFAVRAALAPPLQGFVVAQPFAGGRWARLALLGVPVEGLLAVPTWLPLLVVPASALGIALLWRSRRATWGASLWLGFSTTDLEALAGEGFLDGLWAHPAGGLAFLAGTAGALLLGRRSGHASAAIGLLLLALAAWLAWPASQPPPGAVGLLRGLAVDPWPWPLLAALGLRWERDAGARWCLGLGLAGCLAVLAGVAVDPWPMRALWRLGLVLAAVPVLERASGLLVDRLVSARWRPGQGAGLALLLLLALPGSFAASWNPHELDPLAGGSGQPIQPGLERTAAWMRAHLPADAVVVASPTYVPAVVIEGRRRVLRAPGLDSPSDDLRRLRLERAVFEAASEGRHNARRYGPTHVLVGPGDASLWGLAGAPVPARLQLLAAPAPGFAVYALSGW